MSEWMRDAACLEHPLELFFVEGRGNHHVEQIAKAKKVCAGCHVREECLAYAFRESLEYGIFGGLSPNERIKLRRQGNQPAPRPRTERTCEECGEAFWAYNAARFCCHKCQTRSYKRRKREGGEAA